MDACYAAMERRVAAIEQELQHHRIRNETTDRTQYDQMKSVVSEAVAEQLNVVFSNGSMIASIENKLTEMISSISGTKKLKEPTDYSEALNRIATQLSTIQHQIEQLPSSQVGRDLADTVLTMDRRVGILPTSADMGDLANVIMVHRTPAHTQDPDITNAVKGALGKLPTAEILKDPSATTKVVQTAIGNLPTSETMTEPTDTTKTVRHLIKATAQQQAHGHHIQQTSRDLRDLRAQEPTPHSLTEEESNTTSNTAKVSRPIPPPEDEITRSLPMRRPASRATSSVNKRPSDSAIENLVSSKRLRIELETSKVPQAIPVDASVQSCSVTIYSSPSSSLTSIDHASSTVVENWTSSWTEVDVGRGVHQSAHKPVNLLLLENVLGSTAKEEIIKGDRKTRTHWERFRKVNSPSIRLCYMSRYMSNKEWQAISGEPTGVGRRADNNEWWDMSWKDKSVACPSCQWRRKNGEEGVACCYFVSETSISICDKYED